MRYVDECPICRQADTGDYLENEEMEPLGWIMFECRMCGGEWFSPHDSPSIEGGKHE